MIETLDASRERHVYLDHRMRSDGALAVYWFSEDASVDSVVVFFSDEGSLSLDVSEGYRIGNRKSLAAGEPQYAVFDLSDCHDRSIGRVELRSSADEGGL